MNQSSAFTQFDQNLNLDPKERQEAQELHNELTGHLKREGLIVDAFLQGSFARKTMLPPLHDIDKVVILPASEEEWSRSSLGSPDIVMGRLEDAISDAYPGTSYERKRHALQAAIPGYRFHFDIVPAFEIVRDPDGDILIANREAATLHDQWQRSNTRRLIKVVATRNAECAGQFIHWVRIGKAMTKLRTPDFPGLHTEAICFAANRGPMDDADACTRLFDTGAQLLSTSYTDPTGVDNLSDRIDIGTRLRAQAAFHTAAQQAHEALAYAAAGDHDNACRVWGRIFGDAFPTPAMQSVEATLGASFAGGGITSAGTFTPTSAAHQLTRPARSWSPERP